MYTEVGAFDAKAKLSQLLQEVKQGNCFTITVRGQPIADLIPSAGAAERNVSEAVQMMKKMARVKGISAKNISIWIKEGRR